MFIYLAHPHLNVRQGSYMIVIMQIIIFGSDPNQFTQKIIKINAVVPEKTLISCHWA